VNGVTVFERGGVLYAIATTRPAEGTVGFVTPESAPLQVGVLDRPAGYVVAAHTHPATAPGTGQVSEFLYVESGRLRVDLFDERWQPLGACVLAAGDHIVMFRGGHGAEVLETVRLIEVKQGPVAGGGAAKQFRDVPAGLGR